MINGLGHREAQAVEQAGVEPPHAHDRGADRLPFRREALAEKLEWGDAYGAKDAAEALLRLEVDNETRANAVRDAVHRAVARSGFVNPKDFSAFEVVFEWLLRDPQLHVGAQADALRPPGEARRFTADECADQPVLAAAALMAIVRCGRNVPWLVETLFDAPHSVPRHLHELDHPEAIALGVALADAIAAAGLVDEAGAIEPQWYGGSPAALPLRNRCPASHDLAPTQFRYDDTRAQAPLDDCIARGYPAGTRLAVTQILRSGLPAYKKVDELRVGFLAAVCESGDVLAPRHGPALEQFFECVLADGTLSDEDRAAILRAPPERRLYDKNRRMFVRQPVLLAVAALVFARRHDNFNAREEALNRLGYFLNDMAMDAEDPHTMSLRCAVVRAFADERAP